MSLLSGLVSLFTKPQSHVRAGNVGYFYESATEALSTIPDSELQMFKDNIEADEESVRDDLARHTIKELAEFATKLDISIKTNGKKKSVVIDELIAKAKS